MKFLIAFAGLVLSVSAVVSDIELWSNYKKSYNKVYKSSLEEKLRFGVFQNNLEIINEHNAQPHKSYKMGINQFADWTSQEFRSYLTFKPPTLNYSSVFKPDPNFVVPESFDWREKGIIMEIKDQGNCGSCWAFSATGALQAQNMIHHNKNISLSEQELMDCSGGYHNLGCYGGSMDRAVDYVKDNGIATESDYPYKGIAGDCTEHPRADISVIGYTPVVETEEDLAEAVATLGPASVAICASKLQLYESGILNEPDCTTSLDHGVITVGYGVEGDLKFWIIQNSWGTSWGEEGYFRLARDKNYMCGIGSWNIVPLIE